MVVMHWLCHVVVYWVASFVTMLRYRHAWDSYCARNVCVNQLATVIVAPVLYFGRYAMKPCISDVHGLWQFPAAIVLLDPVFYCIHRLLHSPPFFDLFHRYHHRWSRPTGMSAIDATVTEHIVLNVAPVLFVACVVRMSDAVLMMWVMFVTTNTVVAHASESKHAVHHRNRTKNYGVGLMLMDRLMGTYGTTLKITTTRRTLRLRSSI